MRASHSACSTAILSEASSRSLAEAEPRFLSIHTVTPAEAFSRRPLVVNALAAKRKCEESSLLTPTCASSTLVSLSSFSQSPLHSFSLRSMNVEHNLAWNSRKAHASFIHWPGLAGVADVEETEPRITPFGVVQVDERPGIWTAPAPSHGF